MVDQSALGYTKEHEWVLVEGGVATIGVTAYATGELGDIVYVDLPAVGSAVVAGRVVGEVESSKSVGEVFAPLSGTVVERNEAAIATPELVSSDPFGEGWLIKVEFEALPELLDLEAYTALTTHD